MKCPYCKEEIHDEAIKCKHCRSFLNSDASSEAEGTSTKVLPKKAVVAGISFLLLICTFALFKDAGSNARNGASRSSQPPAISTSDVVGRWSSDADMVDITLGYGGYCTLSYGHHYPDRASWHLNGNMVVIDGGDGGSPITFAYQNGKLVGPSGHYLSQK